MSGAADRTLLRDIARLRGRMGTARNSRPRRGGRVKTMYADATRADASTTFATARAPTRVAGR
ncbi:MAG: hypothetical protein DMF94_06850 [Acidobacteria bacterium]|nr:MAG: hypothetical protein DMF94_06850 [Acidobacteriota bacterium]